MLYHKKLGIVSVVGTIISIVGVVMLWILKKRTSDMELNLHGENIPRKYQYGFIALILCILYTVIVGIAFLDLVEKLKTNNYTSLQ